MTAVIFHLTKIKQLDSNEFGDALSGVEVLLYGTSVSKSKYKCCRKGVFYFGFHMNLSLTLEEDQCKLKAV